MNLGVQINFLELKELNLRGRKYTWSNDTTQTRIDRAFCSTEWDLMLPASLLQALSSLVSDHSPLLLVGATASNTYRGFRFEAFWPKILGYQEVVQHAWTQPVNVFNPFLRWVFWIHATVIFRVLKYAITIHDIGTIPLLF